LDQLSDFHLLNTVRMVRYRRLLCAGHVGGTEERGNTACRIFMEESLGKLTLWRLRRRWEDIIKKS